MTDVRVLLEKQNLNKRLNPDCAYLMWHILKTFKWKNIFFKLSLYREIEKNKIDYDENCFSIVVASSCTLEVYEELPESSNAQRCAHVYRLCMIQ